MLLAMSWLASFFFYMTFSYDSTTEACAIRLPGSRLLLMKEKWEGVQISFSQKEVCILPLANEAICQQFYFMDFFRALSLVGCSP